MGIWIFWIVVIALFTWEWWLEHWQIVGLSIVFSVPLIGIYYALLNLAGWLLGANRKP